MKQATLQHYGQRVTRHVRTPTRARLAEVLQLNAERRHRETGC